MRNSNRTSTYGLCCAAVDGVLAMKFRSLLTQLRHWTQVKSTSDLESPRSIYGTVCSTLYAYRGNRRTPQQFLVELRHAISYQTLPECV